LNELTTKCKHFTTTAYLMFTCSTTNVDLNVSRFTMPIFSCLTHLSGGGKPAGIASPSFLEERCVWRETFMSILQSSPGEADNAPAQRDSEVGAIGKAP
jgi:hypothetical protein